MGDIALKRCSSIDDFQRFLNTLEPTIGKRGGRYFLSRDTKTSHTMNQIVYHFQQILKRKEFDRSEVAKCCELIKKLENAPIFKALDNVGDVKISKTQIRLTRIRQILGNFIFSITHNRFDRKAVLNSLRMYKSTEYEDFAKALNEADESAVRFIFSQKTETEIAIFTKEFLGSLQKKAERDDRRIKLLVAELERRFPKINFKEYFLLKFDGIILCPNGIRIILDYLRSKGSLSTDANIVVCDSLEDLKKEVKKIDWGTEFKMGFLVRGRNKHRPTELHIIPAYIENKPGKPPVVFITDTAGQEESIYNNKKTTYTNMLVQYLEKGMPKDLNPKIYANGFLRQYNWTACPIFSIRDLVQIFRYPQIVEQVKKQVGTKEKPINFLDQLPLILMKPHHSITRLEQIFTSPEASKEIVGFDKSRRPETLVQNVARHKTVVSKEGKEKVINNYTNQREIKYLSVILSRLLV